MLQLTLDRVNLLMRPFPLPKRYLRPFFSHLARCMLRVFQQTSFFVDVAEVLEPLKRHHLIHEVNACWIVVGRLKRLNFDVRVFLVEELLHVVFVTVGRLFPELTLDNEGEGVRHLRFAGENAPHQAGPVYRDGVD